MLRSPHHHGLHCHPPFLTPLSTEHGRWPHPTGLCQSCPTLRSILLALVTGTSLTVAHSSRASYGMLEQLFQGTFFGPFLSSLPLPVLHLDRFLWRRSSSLHPEYEEMVIESPDGAPSHPPTSDRGILDVSGWQGPNGSDLWHPSTTSPLCSPPQCCYSHTSPVSHRSFTRPTS
jgi:hypothetical protein